MACVCITRLVDATSGNATESYAAEISGEDTMPHQALHVIKTAPQESTATEAQRTRAFGLLVLCWLLAGGGFVAVKWAGPFTPPWTMAFFRLLLAALCLLPFARSHYRNMATQLRAQLMAIILIALALAFTQGFMFTGLAYTSAITASIVFSIWPITAIILAAVVLSERFTPWQAAGVILCFGGVLVIVAQGDPDRIVSLDFNAGDLWILGAVAGMSVYTILLKKAKIDLPPLPLLILVLATAALSSTPFFVWEIFHDARSAIDWHDIVALGYIGIIGGGVMFLLYNSGVAVLGAAEASVTFYLQALFTTVLAYLFLGEKLHLYHLAGIALIASGIVIVMLFKQKLPDRATAPGS
jgi:drug/metabolite transporter (DMT)-like permease